MPWKLPHIARHRHRDGIERSAEKPYGVKTGLAILNLGAIVGLAEAQMWRKKTRSAKIAIVKGNH